VQKRAPTPFLPSNGNTHTFAYDALGRRIRAALNTKPATDRYYSAAWQVVEEEVGGSMTAQYVWSPVYVDALVERDTSSEEEKAVGSLFPAPMPEKDSRPLFSVPRHSSF